MKALHYAARIPRHAGRRDEDRDLFGNDVGYPNPIAGYLGLQALFYIVLVVGLLAFVGGLIHNIHEIAGAFPKPSSLLDGSAWAKAALALGRTATLGLIFLALALLVRWRARRVRAR